MTNEDTKVVDETKEVKEEAVIDTNKSDSKEKEAEKKDESAAPAVTEPVPPKVTAHKVNFEKDIIYLYQFSRTPVIPSISPYCLKVETWLRLAGLKYENVDHKMKYRSKKGQLPFVELNGEEIADSGIIIKELGKRFEKDLDSKLSQDQKNIAHAMISMIENNFVWVVMSWRTKFPDNVIKGYKVNLQHALGTRIPNGLLNFFFKFNYVRKGTKKVKAQGIGVHKPEEIEEFGRNDLKVLADVLGDKAFFFGDEPTTLDVVAFAHLAQIYCIDKDVEYPLRDYLETTHSNLVAHINRVKNRCFPDWDDICNNLDLNAHLPKPPPEEKEEKKEEKKEGEEKAEEKSEKAKEIEKESEEKKEDKEEKK